MSSAIAPLFTKSVTNGEGAWMPRSPMTLEDLHAYLKDKIAELLFRQPDLLMSILYRIDVSEFAVTKILAYAATPDIPSLLADLVIDRQLQKIRLRREYTASFDARR